MRLLLALLLAAGGAGCVDTRTCHNPQTWKVCPNTVAEPGASGTPPAITSLSLPTCVYLATPIATGTMHVTDPDSDQHLVKATFFAGVRTNESELPLDAAHQSGTEWDGPLNIEIVGAGGGMLMESTDDVVIEVTDAAGGQSVPYCGTMSVVR